MSTELILLAIAVIALLFYLSEQSKVEQKPLYRTQYITQYVPVPVRRPYRRARLVPPREYPREYPRRKNRKPKGFISGVGTPS